MTCRIALVTEIVAPYRIPVFNELSRLLDDRLEVFFTVARGQRDWEIPREEIRFDHSVLGGFHFTLPIGGDRQPFYVARPLLPRLVRGRFDAVVVGGWNHLECAWSLLYARRWGRRLVLWSETPLLGELPHRPLREAWKRKVIGASDAFVVPGPSSARYLEALGAATGLIHEAPNAVDVDFWSSSTEVDAGADRPFLLYSGRLVARKGVEDAVAAYVQSRLSKEWDFVIAGDGPERSALEAGAPPGVRLLGSTNRHELRRLYHQASMLVFPSHYDPWGLVLNEAAAAGLAAVASDGAGATRDMIRDGENGIVAPAGSVDALRASFDALADDPELAPRLGRKAAELALSYTPHACAAGIAAALEHALHDVPDT